MNRFTAQLDKLSTLPTNPESLWWYKQAIMDIRIAIVGPEAALLPLDQQVILMELHDALKKRYNEARS